MSTESMATQALEPCPFCGGEAEFHPTFWGLQPQVSCQCGAKVWAYSETEAIAVWNTRTPSPTIAEAVLAEREACAKVVDERAEACRMAGVQGDIDPIEAQILDEHLSEAAAAIRNRGGDDGEGVGRS